MKDRLHQQCKDEVGTFERSEYHNDPPDVLRCTHCRIPVQRYEVEIVPERSARKGESRG